MFRWFRETRDGLADVAEAFTGMLDDGRRVFDLAFGTRLGELVAGEVADELNTTEERTDEAERRIRRLLLTRASVHGATDIPACLLYMSVAKDAERVADLSKNVFGIARIVGGPPEGELLADFRRLRDEISPMITESARIFSEEDTEAAGAFIEQARDLQRHCHRQIDELLLERADVPQPAATVLTYRQFARVLANLLNIVSAVVVPLDQLDYPTRVSGEE
jgi:phosphate transport system protein